MAEKNQQTHTPEPLDPTEHWALTITIETWWASIAPITRQALLHPDKLILSETEPVHLDPLAFKHWRELPVDDRATVLLQLMLNTGLITIQPVRATR